MLQKKLNQLLAPNLRYVYNKSSNLPIVMFTLRFSFFSLLTILILSYMVSYISNEPNNKGDNMKNKLNENKPIYLQIKEQLEDSIINDSLKPGERVPSTNEFAAFYQINPATAAKGINELVTEEILYKRRGVGMFVTDKAKDVLVSKRKESFYENFIKPLKVEASNLSIRPNELVEMVMREEQGNED